MSADPQSPFAGVAIFRRRQRFFVLVALGVVYLVVLFLICYHIHLVLEVGSHSARSLRWVAELGTAVPESTRSIIDSLAINDFWVPSCAFMWLYLLVWWRRLDKHAVPARIGVHGEQLLIDGYFVGPLSAISSGSVLPAGGEARTLRLNRRRRSPIELRVRDEAHAAALMQALGLSATQRVVSYPLPSQRGDWRALVVIGLGHCIFWLIAFGCNELIHFWVTRSIPALTLPPDLLEVRRLGYEGFYAIIVSKVQLVLLTELRHFLVFSFLATVVVTTLVCDRALYPRLVVGADGISLVFKGRPRFVPYDQMTRVEVERVGWKTVIHIARTADETITFSLGLGLSQPGPQWIAEQIREARTNATSTANEHISHLRSF